MNLVSVIKYEGDNSTFIWKHPIEDFNTKTQLIVHESQEAIFFMNGQALDTFGPGRHTLTTENIPLIRRFYNFITGDEPFHCEVYFINKVNLMAIKWGTDSQIQYVEPTYGFPISIGACGEMCLRVDEGRKLLLKLVGTGNGFTKDDLTKVFRAFLMAKIKPYLANLIKNRKLNIFEMDSYLDAISEELLILLSKDFQEYGIQLDKFFLTNILKPDGEKTYERFKSLHFRSYADIAEAELLQKVELIDEATKAQRRVIEAQSIAQKRNIEGYSYQEERSFDVAEKVAQNEGVGEFANVGIGMGMMAGIGNGISNATSSVFGNIQQPMHLGGQIKFCTNCGSKLIDGMRFCGNCGKETVVNVQEQCAGCGYQFVGTEMFCPSCGSKRGEK